MNVRRKCLSCFASTVALLTAAAAIVLAAKPAPPPPPAPPAIVFDLHLLGIHEQPGDVNDAGDIVLGFDFILFAGNTTPITVDALPHEEHWAINRLYAINDNWQVACRATYLGETNQG